MKCEKVINDFLNQDDSRYPAFLIRVHIALCSKCREEIKALQNIFIQARTGSPFKMPQNLTDQVMRVVLNSDAVYEKNISSAKWLFTGLVILASIFLVSYSDSLIWLRSHFGSILEVPLFIVLGFVITIYSALYIGSHMDDLKKFIKYVENRIN